MGTTTYQYFKYDHLPEGPLKETSCLFKELASKLEEKIKDGPEKSAGMRKLLEAKDCFVRSVLPGVTPVKRENRP